MAAPPGQANKRIAIDIHPIGLQELQQIRLPASVQPSVFQRALHMAKRFDKYEGNPTGCQLVLACPSMKTIAESMDDPKEFQSALRGKLLQDPAIESMLREEFSRDGGILIDGHSGEILATRSIFSLKKVIWFLPDMAPDTTTPFMWRPAGSVSSLSARKMDT